MVILRNVCAPVPCPRVLCARTRVCHVSCVCTRARVHTCVHLCRAHAYCVRTHVCVMCHVSVHVPVCTHVCTHVCTCAVTTCTVHTHMCVSCVSCGHTRARVHTCVHSSTCMFASALSLPPPRSSDVKAGGADETQGQYGRSESRRASRRPHPACPAPCLACGDTGVV